MIGIEYLGYAGYTNEVIRGHFSRIKAAGIDVVWIFADDIDDFERALRIAEQCGLSVIPTLTTIGPDPQRFLAQFPDEGMVTLDESGQLVGGRIAGEAIIWIPEQMLGPCFRSPAFQQAYADFVTHFISRFRDEPAFYRYSGRPVFEFVREAWYRTGHRELGVYTRPSCYCKHCTDQYRASLRQRFGALTRLNAAMGTGFGAWDEVAPPRDSASRAYWKDWLDFHAGAIPQFLAAGIRAGRSVMPDLVATHELNDWYPVWWDSVFTGNDYYRMAKELDICFEDMYPIEHHHVHAIYLYEYTKEIALAAGGFAKPVWANAQALVGWIDFYPPPAGWEIEQVYSAVAHGASGIAWWHDFHGPDVPHRVDIQRYGDLPDLLLENTAPANAEAKRLLASTAGFERLPSQVAILYSWTTMELAMDDVHPYDALQTYAALVRGNYRADVLSEEQVAAGLLTERGYRVLFAAGCSALPDVVRGAIAEFVQAGGVLVQDFSGAAGEPHTSLFKERVRAGDGGGASYIMINDLLVRRGVSYPVRAHAEVLQPVPGDRVLAVYDNGQPAALMFQLGRGRVYRFGSLIGVDYAGWQPGVFEYKEPRFLTYVDHNEDLRALLEAILAQAGVEAMASTSQPAVEAVVLQRGAARKVLVINHRYEPVTATVRVHAGADACCAVDVKSGEQLPADGLAGWITFSLRLDRVSGREIDLLPGGR